MSDLTQRLREQLKHIKFIRAAGNAYRIRQTLSILKKWRDYELTRQQGRYQLTYTNRWGYQLDDLSPTFFFDYTRWAWEVGFDGQTILTRACPLWELIMELRGYLLTYWPQPGDVVIDVGASTGFVASSFARLVGPTGRVICLEPDPDSVKKLQDTLALNQISNCVVFHYALSTQNGTASFTPAGGASHLTRTHAVNSLAVETITLPALLERASVQPGDVKLIKLDIEGSEVDVLDDLLSFLKNNRQTVIELAAYHPYQGQPTSKWLEQHCQPYRYVAVKTIFPIHTTTVLVHVENDQVLQRLTALPSYEEHVNSA